MPHAHILIILADNYKPDNIDIIDNIVSAEIPDSELNPLLFNAVVTHMVHGPCGINNPNSVCMKNKECSKNFPKQLQQNTEITNNTFPKYKRNSGFTIQIRNAKIGDENIVPYNPYLLLKYNCHINVEICTSIKAVKYLFKYIYKGHDCANIQFINENTDEILNYLDTR